MDAKIIFDDVETFPEILPLLKTETENLDVEKEPNVTIESEIIGNDEMLTSTVDKIEMQDLDLKNAFRFWSSLNKDNMVKNSKRSFFKKYQKYKYFFLVYDF